MHNVWQVFRHDVASLLSNVMSVIITVGLVVLPSLFAWYNILACWDVFGNTGHLPIAVASEDEGFTSDLLPIDVNVGDKVLSALRANEQIDWQVTDAKSAIEGTKAGTYYAALVVPADFSRQMLTFYEGDSGSATIRYYVNEKKNAISPNITGAGADTVSAQVNEAFSQAITEIAVGMAQTVSQHADGIDVNRQITGLTGRMRSTALRIEQAADVLGLYGGLAGDSQSMLASGAELVDTARAGIDEAKKSASEDAEALRSIAAQLSSSIDALAGSLDGSRSRIAELAGLADSLPAGVSDDAAAVAGMLRDAASGFDGQASDVAARQAELEQLRDELHEGLTRGFEDSSSEGPVEWEYSEEITITTNSTILLDKNIAMLSRMTEILQQASANLVEAADGLEDGSRSVQDAIAGLSQNASQAQDGIDRVRSDVEATLRPGIDRLKADLDTLVSDVQSAADKLNAANPGLSGAADDTQEALGGVAESVDAARDKLQSAADEMRGLATRIESALSAGDADLLRSLLNGGVDKLVTSISAPVEIERHALFPVDNFGSAMAPLYCALALFIGSLLIMVAMKPEVSSRVREELDDPKPRHLFFGRLGTVALVSLMQTTLLGLGNMLFLKLQVSDPVLYMACFWISGLILAFIIYTLVVAFGNLGKAIAVLLLIVQVTACGGSYPLQILPDFITSISPWVPATHIVDAMRAAMFGVYQNDFWISIGKLACFVPPFLLLGLVLHKPLDRFMHFYVSKVEECGLVE